jgi:hypothetical protein
MNLAVARPARLGIQRPDYIVALLQFVLQQAEGLPRQTAEAVAVHRARPRVPACDYTKPRTALAGRRMQTDATEVGGPTASEH